MNSFLSLFYIAFYLQDMDRLQDVSSFELLFCISHKNRGKSETDVGFYVRAFILVVVRVLFQQLAAIFITRQVIGNIKEAIIPFVIEKLKLFKIGYDMTAAMSPDTLAREMREMTGIDTRRRSKDQKKVSSKTSNDGLTDEGLEPLIVAGTSEEDEQTKRLIAEAEEMASQDTTVKESRDDNDKEVKFESESLKDSAECLKSDEQEDDEDSQEKTGLRFRNVSNDGSVESELLEDDSLLEDVAFDSGKLASSGPTLTQAEVEATMKKVRFFAVTIIGNIFSFTAL